jgi:hypothetical protein
MLLMKPLLGQALAAGRPSTMMGVRTPDISPALAASPRGPTCMLRWIASGRQAVSRGVDFGFAAPTILRHKPDCGMFLAASRRGTAALEQRRHETWSAITFRLFSALWSL